MKNKVKVSVVRAIQFRTEYTDSDGKVHGWNHKYQKPTAAAAYWADKVVAQWEDRKFRLNGTAAYHNMTDVDYEQKRRIYDKAYRRILPVFKRILAGE